METLLQVVAAVLGLLPVILAFYIPALLGVAIWSERGSGYRAKSVLTFVLGFGAILAILLLFRNVSAPQVLATVGLSLVQIFAALVLAALTVYKLAD